MADKRIALICNTYIRNYGSVLQSLATYRTIRSMGYDADVVNYKDYPHGKAKLEILIRLKLPMLSDLSFVRKKLRNKLSMTDDGNRYMQIVSKRNAVFDDYVKDHFSFTDACANVDDVKNAISSYDAVVIGSDQLWGPADIIRDYHTLNFVPESMPKISYATSFGVSSIPGFLQKRTAAFLKRLDHISVREDAGAGIVKSLTGLDVPVVVDPTLLLTDKDWDIILDENASRKIEDKYMFCFFLGDNNEQRDLAKKISRHLGLPIVSIQHMDEYVKHAECFADIDINDASPADFVNLIKNAEIVLCDSFHASVFSIQYRKSFYTFDRYNPKSSNARNSRIETLLKRLEIPQRHITDADNADIKSLLENKIDYDNVHKCLEEWRAGSRKYLNDSLSGI